jgi:hypothetical protein
MLSATKCRRFDAPRKRLLDAVDAALEDIGATGVRWSRDDSTVRASMPMQFFVSYGENLTVEVFDDGEVEVRSEYTFPLQLFDFVGKNARNCRQLLDAISDILNDE